MHIFLQLGIDIIGVNGHADFRGVAAAGIEGDVIEDLFKHRVQAARADVFGGFIGLPRILGDGFQGGILEIQGYAVHAQQQLVLADQRVFRLGKDQLVIFYGQRLQIHAHGEAALQLRNQVGYLGHNP